MELMYQRFNIHITKDVCLSVCLSASVAATIYKVFRHIGGEDWHIQGFDGET